MNQVRVQFDLRERIIEAEDDQFKRIKGQIEKGELKKPRIENRVIKHENRLCVPQTGGLTEEIMRAKHIVHQTLLTQGELRCTKICYIISGGTK